MKELIPVFQEGIYKIQDYEKVINDVQAFIDERKFDNLVITDKSDLTTVRKARAEINKQVDLLKSQKKAITEYLVGTLNNQLGEMVKLLESASLSLKTIIDENKEPTLPKEKVITLTVKGTDSEKIAKVQEFALKLELKADIKGE